MPGFGPPPAEQKRRRNKDTFEEHTVEVSAGARGDVHELPGRDDLHSDTVRWWDAWAESPVTSACLSTDWDVLLRLVKAVEAYNRCPVEDVNALVKLEGAIRQRESLLGATHVDRMRARLKVGDGKAEQPRTSPAEGEASGNVTPIDRKKRLLAADA